MNNFKGVMRIWGIQGFANKAKRVAKVNLLMKTNKLQFITEYPFFQNSVTNFIQITNGHCIYMINIFSDSFVDVFLGWRREKNSAI